MLPILGEDDARDSQEHDLYGRLAPESGQIILSRPGTENLIVALASGTQIGPYTIGDEIGSGGMGVVYRAADKNLKRDVAIKALPESLATDAERLARFQREAEVLASLNHPNITQIYGLEKADGATALIMELVDGETLADRIAKGPLPPDEALDIAMQIAEALEAAHGQNIVHRDLKPANVKLRSDGTVKVLDFGIAKALEPENLASGPQSPMMTTPATMAGVILGTAAYMSPEQAKGKAVDQRTDIWAFGCVLYEMLTGQLAFGAEDVPTTLARVIDRDTDLDSLPATVSLAVRQTIQLCLRKDVGRRIADIRDVRLALQGDFEAGTTQTGEMVAAARPFWRRVGPVAAAFTFGSLLVGAILWPEPEAEREPLPVNRFDYELPEGRSFRANNRRVVAISPDGRYFVYNGNDGLYLRTLGELAARLIPGTEPNMSLPIFSPDGQSVAYGVPAQLMRIAISGGAPVVIGDLGSNPGGISWETDGTILVGQPEGILRVSANGGTPELVIPAQEGTYLYGPELLPDGDSVLFSVAAPGDFDAAEIVAQRLSTGERTVLHVGGSEARYLRTGHLVYALDDDLFAVAFDSDTLAVSGGPVPLVQGVARAGGNLGAAASYDVSDTGTLVYVVAGGLGAADIRTLVWVDREGREEPINVPPRAYTSPRISPDGTKVVLNPRDQENDVWTWDLVRNTLTRLTFNPGWDRSPLWSPDGERIAFSSPLAEGGGDALFWQAADGSSAAEQLSQSKFEIFPTSFLPDETAVVVWGDFGNTDTSEDIAIVQLDGDDQTVMPLLQTPFRERMPKLSPDGRWLAYTSNESGQDEVYVRSFPNVGSGGRWQVSTDGGEQPVWAADGQELFYRNGDAMMAVPIESTDESFIQGIPEVVFEGQYVTLNIGGQDYDVSPDGERFLMMKEVQGTSVAARIIVVENWFTELERLVPTAE